MQITRQVTQQDFVEALKACRQRSPFRKWIWRLLSAIPIAASMPVCCPLFYGLRFATHVEFVAAVAARGVLDGAFVG